jgi:hypothetical protein
MDCWPQRGDPKAAPFVAGMRRSPSFSRCQKFGVKDGDVFRLDFAKRVFSRIAPSQSELVVVGARDHGGPPALDLLFLIPIGRENRRTDA